MAEKDAINKKEENATKKVIKPPSQIYSEIEKFTKYEAQKIILKQKLAEEERIKQEKLAAAGR